MQIGDLLNTYNNNLAQPTDIAPKTQGVEQVVKTTETLEKGNIFEGTINSVDGSKVTIGLASGQTISARLDTGVSLSNGQSVFFEVKANDGSVVQIRPVSTDITGNPTLLKALDTASLPVGERTLNMVNSMMKEQMPIDANSLLNMNKVMAANPDINPNTVVTMTKLGLPLSIEMANQFEAYASNEAQITNDLKEVVNSIPLALTSQELNSQQTVELNNSLLSAFGIEAKEMSETENASGQIAGQNSALVTAESQTVRLQTAISQADASEVTVSENAVSQTDAAQPAVSQTSSDVLNGISQQTVREGTELTDSDTKSIAQSSTDSLNGILTQKNYTALNNAVLNLPDFKDKEPALFDEKGNLRTDITAKDFLSAMMDYSNKTDSIPKEKLDSLFGTGAYKKLLSNVAEKSWTLKPEQLTKEGEVEKLYERIARQTDDILAASERAGKAATELSKSAAEVRDNVSFMNQVNELYNFVQIPVKLSNQTANSDLYVFQNKKKNYEEGDELTAFLHFDLEHLGSTDISVKMQRKNVSCDWFLENEESLKLIEANLDKLENRLRAKGYNCSFSATSGDKEINFVEDFLKQDSKPAGMVHRYSFDMRA